MKPKNNLSKCLVPQVPKLLFRTTYVVLWFSLLTVFSVKSQTNSVSATYTVGVIPSDLGFQNASQSSTCPGVLTVEIPAGANIIGVDVVYTVNSGNSWASRIRSQLRCLSPGGLPESEVYNGCCMSSSNTETYSRQNLDIANNVTGGGQIIFELHLGRTVNGSGCEQARGRVNNSTWTVTVHFTEEDPCPPTPISFTQNETSCGAFTWVDGNTYAESAQTPTHTFITDAGCDSVVTLNLTVVNLDNEVSVESTHLEAHQVNNATYQWLDCLNSNQPISGATSATFTPLVSGEYAVKITSSQIADCSIISDCHPFTVSQSDLSVGSLTQNQFSFYPNPTSDFVSFTFTETGGTIHILDVLGNVVLQKSIDTKNIEIDLTDLTSRKYLMRYESNNWVTTKPIIKFN